MKIKLMPEKQTPITVTVFEVKDRVKLAEMLGKALHPMGKKTGKPLPLGIVSTEKDGIATYRVEPWSSIRARMVRAKKPKSAPVKEASE